MNAVVKRRHIEDDHMVYLMRWARFEKLVGEDIPAGILPGSHISDYLIHYPNGGRRNLREAARLKQMGVKAGVSDLFLAVPCYGWRGLWIELKRPLESFKNASSAKDAVTDAQRKWGSQMLGVGYAFEIAYGWEAARNAIIYYLGR